LTGGRFSPRSSVRSARFSRRWLGSPLVQTLQAHLHGRALLLLLDNFEHVVAAAPVVADLLMASPRLRVLATSRARLHIQGEHEVAVPPLGLPELQVPAEPGALLGSEAVRLFQERAQATLANFAVTSQNGEVVAEICRHLDGLPLAIELAAARIKVLPPAALLSHLQRRLPILTGGPRDVLTRHQTLRETIAWSYQLLSVSEQRLFRRMSVFVGGSTLIAVGAVCHDSEAQPEVLDRVAALVEKSLLQPVESVTTEPRFRLLETIREYGLDQLAASGESEMVGRSHAEYFLTLSEAAEPGLAGADWRSWRWRLDAERENLRAALGWAAAWGETEIALGLVGPLWRWFRPDAIAEGRRWVQEALALPGSAGPARALVLHTLGVLAMQQGEYRVAAAAWKESISVWRAVGDIPRLAEALMYLGSIYRPSARAVPALLGESLALARQVGDPRLLALALGFLAWQVLQSDGPATASRLLAEALPLARVPGDPWELIWVLYVSGLLAVRERDYATATARFAEVLDLARGARDSMMAALALAASGRAALQERDAHRASTLFCDGLVLSRDAGFAVGLAYHLEGIAMVYCERSQHERAARLLGAASAAYALVDVPGLVPYSSLVDQAVAALRQRLGSQKFSTLHAEGRELTRVEAIAEALTVAADIDLANHDDVPVAGPSTLVSRLPAPDHLTAREVEVLRLLAAGHSNPEIAAALVLSVKTVERHLANLYAKIGARGRVDAATYAVARNLE
jgi:predicted ATPase/DNA-binding NarL/FixJ family response regulator